jgi:hypothetical protein
LFLTGCVYEAPLTEEHIDILSDPNHPEYQEYNEWLKGHAKNYFPYEADKFEPDKVGFWDPNKKVENGLSTVINGILTRPLTRTFHDTPCGLWPPL